MTVLVEGRRFRWHGSAAEVEQPDAGDLLRIVPSDERAPETYLLIHGALQVRGKPEHELWLWVTRSQIGADGTIPDDLFEAILGSGRIYDCVLDRRRRR